MLWNLNAEFWRRIKVLVESNCRGIKMVHSVGCVLIGVTIEPNISIVITWMAEIGVLRRGSTRLFFIINIEARPRLARHEWGIEISVLRIPTTFVNFRNDWKFISLCQQHQDHRRSPGLRNLCESLHRDCRNTRRCDNDLQREPRDWQQGSRRMRFCS